MSKKKSAQAEGGSRNRKLLPRLKTKMRVRSKNLVSKKSQAGLFRVFGPQERLSSVAGGMEDPAAWHKEFARGLAGRCGWIEELLDGRPSPHAGMRSAALQAGLTDREADTFSAMAAGLSNREIAKALGISYDTARAHIRNIFEKLDATSRVEAVNAVLGRAAR